MNSELQIIEHQGKFVTDSRDIAAMTDKPHNDLLKAIRQYCGYLTQGNFSLSDFFIEHTYQDSTGRTLPCYLITRKGCDMVANKMTGEKGVLFTAAYVTKFEEMEKQLQPQFKLPQTFAEALRQLASAVEEKEQLAQQNALMLPKAEFFDAVADSKTAISIGEVAKVLAINGLGRNKLFQMLRDLKVLQRDNVPYQEFVDRGYFRVIEQKYQVDGEPRISIKTLVYQKGLDYIRRVITAKLAS